MGNKMKSEGMKSGKKNIKKKVAVLVLLGAYAGAGMAQTAVNIGGRVDVGYVFKNAANPDIKNAVVVPGGNQGGTTTETMADNSATTSRMTVTATEDLGKGYGASVYLDLRFGSFVEGKTGFSSNDRKSMTLSSPFGYVQWGVQNLAGETFTVAEKPYMSTPKDMNNVKYGVAQIRETTLTNRSTEVRTAAIPIGPVKLAFKGTYAFGDNRKDGSSNIDGTNSGDIYSAGFEGAYGSVSNAMESNKPFMSWGYDINTKATSSLATNKNDSIVFAKAFYNIRPIADLKLSISMDAYKGYNPNLVGTSYGTAFKEKNWSLNAVYYWSDKLVMGAYYSRLNDLASNRNSGMGLGGGAYYYLSKTFAAYVMRGNQNFSRNESFTGGKYDGTAAGAIGNVTKLNQHSTYVGLIKDF